MLRLTAFLLLSALPAQAEPPLQVFPKTISNDCFAGRAVSYDECGFQRDLFDRALRAANKSDKRLLVVFGAEWCIWCHVFKEHLKGKSGQFNYTIAGQTGYKMDERATDGDRAMATKLSTFASENFVIVNIEGQHSFDGDSVLSYTGADAFIGSTIPYIFVVDQYGEFLRAMPSNAENKVMVKRREGDDMYRGYNRAELMKQLKILAG